MMELSLMKIILLSMLMEHQLDMMKTAVLFHTMSMNKVHMSLS